MKVAFLALAVSIAFGARAFALPSVVEPNLRAEAVVSGLDFPTTMAFIGSDDILVLQKNDGKVMRVHNGAATAVLDLNVDFNDEHGLLGIALHPDFANNGFVYLYYTESSAAGDSSNAAAANRVYKFHWDGSALALAQVSPILSLPVTPGPNHNGGVIAFGPDQKLYVINGDLNRNGQLQNFSNGPAPDGTSVIHRLNDDGTAAAVNPFSSLGAPLDQYFAYGIRNSFGMTFDPVTNKLWDTENGPNSYDEINLVEPGFNSGWESIMGPDSRNTNNAPQDLFVIPGSHYADPKFSWFNTVGPTAIVFLNSTQLGAQYENDVFVGDINNGRIYHLVLNANRDGFALGTLTDTVADNESQLAPFVFGTGFNGVTDLKVGPDGFLYVVSLFDGAIYRIVPAVPPLTIDTIAFPPAQIGVPYVEDLDISGGSGPYAISQTGGVLPPGIAPTATGIGGTPTTAKKFKFTLQVTDDDGATVSKQFGIQVFKALAIPPQTLRIGRAGKNYKAALKATGGKPPYQWALKNGSALPGPLILTPAGQIAGFPVSASSGPVTFQVTDDLGVIQETTLTLTIN